MRLTFFALITAGLLALLLPATAGAHAPLRTGGNESLATATEIPDPGKSWAMYNRLAGAGQAQYYSFEAAEGQEVPVNVFTSPDGEADGFVPEVALMGPGIPGDDAIPGFVERPDGAGVVILEGEASSDIAYEPFSPSATREIGETTFRVPAGGTYYAVVYSEERGGRYGLAIGSSESFTPFEWVTLPYFVATIYAWEGQPLWLVYLPAAVVVLAGVLLLWRRSRALDPPAWVAALAGLFFIGSGVTFAVQMTVSLIWASFTAAALVSVVLAALPIALGAGVLVLALRRSGGWTLGSRLLLALLGAAGLGLWAGWIVGPAMAVVAALLPSGKAAAKAEMEEPPQARRAA